jgi:hypothetical protein
MIKVRTNGINRTLTAAAGAVLANCKDLGTNQFPAPTQPTLPCDHNFYDPVKPNGA